MNMTIFYRLKINDENNDISNLQQEDEYNDNYESVEERPLFKKLLYCFIFIVCIS